jgi:hypothetical protein
MRRVAVSRTTRALGAVPAAVLFAVVSAVLLAIGCAQDPGTDGNPLMGDNNNGGDDASTKPTPSNTGCTPTPPMKINPSDLPKCCTDAPNDAHCVPSAYVPSADTAALASCSGGYCVPDKFITDPTYQPAKCTAFNMTDGVCLSLCIPQVDMYKTILQQGSCGANELCAPCVNPLNMQSSGACDIGKSTGGSCSDAGGGPPKDAGTPDAAIACPYKGPPLIDPSKLPSCDPNGGAHCLSANLVPASEQSQLATCTGGFCVPDAFIETGGNFIPPTCASLDGAEGRCLSEIIPQVAKQLTQLPQSTCQKYERCVPCYSPLDGTATGACKLSCDPGPTKPPVLFPDCCNENNMNDGRCIPTQLVPQSEQSNLSQDVCMNQGDLCVPKEMLDPNFKPPQCTGNGFLIGQYDGVCLSNCLSFGIQGIVLDQGTCDDIHTCAPCTNPITGQPTGAPGCP